MQCGKKGTVPAGQTQHLTMKLMELTHMITNGSDLYLGVSGSNLGWDIDPSDKGVSLCLK